MRISPLSKTLLAGLMASSALSAQAGTTLDLSTGLSYSSGEYGETASTDVFVVPLSAKLRTGNWTFKASVPYLRVDGPANAAVVLDDSGGGDGGGGSGRDHPEDDGEDPISGAAADRKESGFGDTSLSATYSFDQLGGSSTYLDLTGRVRLPTGDEGKGLGIDTTDYGLSAEFGIDKDAGGAYIMAGRRFLGDADAFAREDGWQAGVGAWRNLGERSSIGIGYDWRESSTGTGQDPAEIYAYLSVKMSDAWKINLNGSGGLNDASADYSVGVNLTWRAIDR
ncbi:MAG: hypothetical protein IT473_14025 [Lysobacter sp.]|nr:hypothetical protein [Lysobacter sp.]